MKLRNTMTGKVQNTYSCFQAEYFTAFTDWCRQFAKLESQDTLCNLSHVQVLCTLNMIILLSETKLTKVLPCRCMCNLIICVRELVPSTDMALISFV